MKEFATVVGQRREEIYQAVCQALDKARAAGRLNYEALPDFAVERPREASHGDFAVNVAMMLAKPCHMAPRDVAKAIAEYIDFDGTEVAAMEIAGPGFLNFRLREGWLGRLLREMRAEGERFGSSDAGQGQRVQIEFVSANPTGDLHMGNARGAAIGDSLAGVMALAGYQVQREYYVNDAGNQIEKFAETLDVLYRQALGEDIPFPEDGYHGADLPVMIGQLVAEVGDKYLHVEENLRREYLAEYGLKQKLAAIRQALDDFGVHYDVWFSEQSLHDSGAVREVVSELAEQGWLLEKDGAVWLDCARFPEEAAKPEAERAKAEVLVRANGLPTYFAADIAYHRDKFRRGFDTVIDVWGADHHGHVARMKGAIEAIGYRREQLEVILMQFVRLYQNGELLKMSKRTGTYVTLEELVEEVGRDAARFFFILRSADSLIDFDMDLARSKSADNPVYYVQYAHARICSILAQAGAADGCGDFDGDCFREPQELALIRRLGDYPDEVIAAALNREPHRVACYLLELAGLFHAFYGACHCMVEDEALKQARLALVRQTKQVLASGLGVLGVSAPEQM